MRKQKRRRSLHSRRNRDTFERPDERFVLLYNNTIRGIMKKHHIKTILKHIFCWLILILTHLISEWGYHDKFTEGIWLELIFLPPRLIAVYLNWFILIPFFLQQNKILRYVLTLLGCLLLLSIIQRYFTLFWAYPIFFPQWMADTPNPNPWVLSRLVQNLVIITSPVAFSTGIKLFLEWYEQKNRTQQLEKDKAKAELKYLRSQVNPHFLFNTLNSLYGLSLEQSKKVPQLLLKLSDLLSYSLYESSVSEINLQKELNMITDFVALEIERYEDRVNVIWEIDRNNDQEVMIPPLILMPFVENAFKHGVKEEVGETQVIIRLKVDDHQLHYQVENSFPLPEFDQQKGEGIGLTNLERRLQILYPKQYELKTIKEQAYFTAILKLKLQE